MPKLMRAARAWRPAAVVLALITALGTGSLWPGAAQAATTPPPAVGSASPAASPAASSSGTAQPSASATARAGQQQQQQHVSLHAYWPTGGKVRSARQISRFIAGGRNPARMPGLVAARPATPGGSTGAAARSRAGTCYSVSAFIPDNYADNTQAHYNVGSTLEGFGFTFDQATATGWSDLGTLTTGSNGIITVSLNDVGPTADYTAADAMEFDEGGAGC